MLDNINPTSEWIEKSHPTKFDVDYDIDAMELKGVGPNIDPIVRLRDEVSKAPSMAHASTNRAT